MKKYPCPCCGHFTYPVPPDQDCGFICPVCFWENDPFLTSEEESSDQNHGITLKKARSNFLQFGACEREMLRYVRPPKKDEKNERETLPRINMIGRYLKDTFGEKVVKLSLDGGFTCPNRDGTKGTGGCIFCSADGSGDFAGSIPSQIELLSSKWPRAKYIAYFQNYTNTYAPVAELRQKFTEALEYGRDLPPDIRPEIIGLAIATRPDCLNEEVYELLAELNQKIFLWVELGLQSSCEETGETINRCHTLAEYDEAVSRLAKLGIRTVTHLIFGLPKRILMKRGIMSCTCLPDSCAGASGIVVIPETRQDMLESVRHVCRELPLNPTTGSHHLFGIKLHMLNVVRGSQMERICPHYVPFPDIDTYTDLVVRALRIIPPDITLHRLSADAPRPILIAPEWSYRKRTILNTIHRKMQERDLYQGQDWHPDE